MERILSDVIRLYLIPHFTSLGMEATGEWREHIHARGNTIWGRNYTEQLVYGRRPGKFAPIAPLIKWVEAKFGITGDEGVNVAWAVNQKIKAQGTEYWIFGGTDLLDFLNTDEVRDYIVEQSKELITERVVFSIKRNMNKI